MEATGPNTRITVERLAGPANGSVSSNATVGRSSLVRLALLLVVVATVGWLVAAPSTPALIAVVSAVIASVGWGDGPDDSPAP